MQISGAPDPGIIPASDAVHPNSWYNQDFEGYRITEEILFTKRPLRIVCVGAGAAGLQIAYKAERALENVTLQIYEKNSDVGGTWLENRYPGCTCDIPSHAYQFSWARNPSWSAYYSSAEEIWQYMKDTAVRYDLEKYIKFNTTVKEAQWDEGTGRWNLKILTAEGAGDDWCDILVSASGVLNEWKYPDIEGMGAYKGKLMHSARWDSSYDLAGKTVAVIGGGSSGVQIIPNIQPHVVKLVAFLRSPYSEEQIEEFKTDPVKYDKYCRDVEGELNKRFNLLHVNSNDQKNSRELIANLMKQKLGNEKLAAKLVPDFALGCRRMTPGSGYLESLSKDNVEVVHQGVARFTEKGVVDAEGVEHQVDAVICATGFETSFTPHFKMIGRDGADIKEQFGDFPKAYLGITARNFPNFFLLAGPNSPTSHGSFLQILEWYTRYMFQVIEKFQKEDIKTFEPKAEAIRDLYNHTHELMKRLAWSSPCQSWFKNGKTHGPVTAIYPGSRLHFFEVMKTPRYEDYDITYRTGNRFQFMGNGFTECESSADGDPVWYFDDPFTRI
ncbi:FAD/NAD(P)-binding domain-containing protein [Thozetella sp. PMI_491]|nr:FAD/NAD(P)-binding domain-containing protein [Thozetella sp. PMI_491]